MRKVDEPPAVEFSAQRVSAFPAQRNRFGRVDFEDLGDRVPRHCSECDNRFRPGAIKDLFLDFLAELDNLFPILEISPAR